MAEDKRKKSNILKPSHVLNWAVQNFLRFDDTKASILRLATNPPQVSLMPINRLCKKLAYREITFSEAEEKCSNYTGYLKMASDQFMPAFYNYLEENQIEATDEFESDRFRLPIGKFPNGDSNFIKVDPTYFALEGQNVIPTFLLGWTKIPFKQYQKQLISSIIYHAILTRQDFIGSDAEIITFERNKWSKTERIRGGWRVSQYADLSMDDLQKQFDRYNRALREVVEFLNQGG